MSKKSYLNVIDVMVDGIPCKVGIIDFYQSAGSYSYNANSDHDYYGYCEMDWNLLDRKGYLAGNWLTRKMSGSKVREIEEQIREAMTDTFDI